MRETIVAGFFARPAARAASRPRVRIITDREIGPAPLRVKFRIDATTPNGPVRQVFWDFDDETFSIQADPVHTFDQPGKYYRVAVTIIDAQGISANATVRIGVQTKGGGYSRQPFRTDDHTLMLYHFDWLATWPTTRGTSLRLS